MSLPRCIIVKDFNDGLSSAWRSTGQWLSSELHSFACKKLKNKLNKEGRENPGLKS